MKRYFSVNQGLIGNYVNPSGYIHELITLYNTKNLWIIGRPNSEFSWFEGYGWQIAICGRCGGHIGWCFSTESSLSPKLFYGLSRENIVTSEKEQNENIFFTPQIENNENNENENNENENQNENEEIIQNNENSSENNENEIIQINLNENSNENQFKK